MPLAIAVALVCGAGGTYFAKHVVGAIGRATNHTEPVLRALGWCWGGLPFVLVAVLFAVRHKLSRSAKLVLTYVLVAWIASGALLIPSRGSSMRHRFDEAYPDARVLAFGWAAGILAVFAAGLLTAIGILVLQKLLGPPDKKQLTIFSRALGAGWLILTAAGLAYALVGPLP